MVTGAAKRVGRETALQIAAAGGSLLIHFHRSEKAARQLKARIEKKYGVRVFLVQGDLGSYEQIERIAEQAWQAFGNIDVLVHNASTFYPTPLGKVSEAEWDDLFAVNAKAPFFLSQDIGLRMKKRGRGKIIHIADWAAKHPYQGYIPYCASKAALLAVAQGLAKSLAPQVQVNSILPGPVMWPDDLGEKVKRSVLKQTPLARIGSAEDVASAVKFFIEGNDFMTGSELHVDGGRHID